MNKKIVVTGGTGMVGQSFTRFKTGHNLVLLGSKDYNLSCSEETNKMIIDHKPDAIVHLAAKVGGVKGNTDHVSDFYYNNVLINTNLLEASRKNGVKKVVSLLSTCIYPDKAYYPLTEEQIHKGEPHASNFGYAYAKRMLEVQSRAIRQQYGLKYITVVPNNLYGINDNFDISNGHVIPSIIRKIYEAKMTGELPVFWGTGKSLREFTYADDIARAIIALIDTYEEKEPLNIGKTGEISIYSLVRKVCKILDYKGNVIWDKEKPEGQYRKPSSNENFMNVCKDFRYTSLDDGLKLTCDWFVKSYPKVRGI